MEEGETVSDCVLCREKGGGGSGGLHMEKNTRNFSLLFPNMSPCIVCKIL